MTRSYLTLALAALIATPVVAAPAVDPALTAAIDKRVRFDAAQTLTVLEQQQARTNIGAVAASDIGDVATDFVAIFEAALV